MKFNKGTIIGTIGIIVSIILIIYLFKRFDFDKVVALIARVNIVYVILLVLIYASVFPLQALRWKRMLINYSSISYNDLFKSIVISAVGCNILPARGGELLRMEFINRKFTIARITLLSSILIEKIFDGIILLFILFVCTYFIDESLQSGWIKNLIVVINLTFLFTISILLSVRVFGKKIISYFTSPAKWSLMIKNSISKIYSAIEFISWDLNFFYILLLSTCIWFLEGLMFVIALQAFGIDVNPFLAGFFALCIVNFGTVIPSSPGFIGVFQGFTLIALSIFDITQNKSLAVGLLINFIQYLTVMLLGLYILKDFKKLKILKK
ncbi:MAG TPA: lysylphosphatidylglycerol synthase transmembrane domain-containing protein [Cytophagaceae bacterium]|jgi:uncharacterized protein (TIRG00374 family)|nr:lysylphosphatidylglycerol synthase transmembrane domain-containing protein [Cytophagaceae bacterium]